MVSGVKYVKDYKNEERLLLVPEGTSKAEFFRLVRKPDSSIGQNECEKDSCEIFFYAFPDRFVSPTRENYYLVSFKNDKLYRVVLAETQSYDHRPSFQQFIDTFRWHQITPEQQQQAEEKRMSALRNVLGISTDSGK